MRVCTNNRSPFESLARQVDGLNDCFLRVQTCEAGKMNPEKFAKFVSNPAELENILESIKKAFWKPSWERLALEIISDTQRNASIEVLQHNSPPLQVGKKTGGKQMRYVIVKEGSCYHSTRPIDCAPQLFDDIY